MINIRDQWFLNQDDFLIYTADYVVQSHSNIAHPMFTHADQLYERVTELNILDFIPSTEDQTYLYTTFESMIYEMIKKFLVYDDIKLSKNEFSMSKIFELDPQNRPEIITLSIYDLNEDVIAELIKILDKIQSDINLSLNQVKQNILLYKSDFMTVWQNRYFAFQ